MACCTNLIVLFTLLLASCSYGQRDKKFFRKDYKYVEATDSFYKFHTIRKSWFDAQRVCETEGATFFYPEDQMEAETITDLWNKTQPFGSVYIAVSSHIVKGVFETVDGNPISEAYENWSPGEPNDADGVEDCVVMGKDKRMNDVNCENKYAFVCKKTLNSLEWNTICAMPNLDYTYDENLGKCYKLHQEPLPWQEAYASCAYEQSYLVVINSQEEADLMVKMAETAPKDVEGDLTAIHIGFHKKPKGWTTVKGTKLANSGYAKWGDQQPDNTGDAKCGAMSYDGLLRSVPCAQQSLFICEHDVSVLGNIVDERYGNN